MSHVVRFATVCDCGAKSEEYTAWPSCRDCGEYICPACMVPGSASEDEANLGTCKACTALAEEDDPREPDDDDGRTYADPRDEREERDRR